MRIIGFTAAVALFVSACSVSPPISLPSIHDSDASFILTTTQGAEWVGSKDSGNAHKSKYGNFRDPRVEWMPAFTLRLPVNERETALIPWINPFANFVAAGISAGVYMNIGPYASISPYASPIYVYSDSLKMAYGVNLAFRCFEYHYPLLIGWEVDDVPYSKSPWNGVHAIGLVFPRSEYRNRYSIGLSYEYENIGGGLALDMDLSPGVSRFGARIFTSLGFPSSVVPRPRDPFKGGKPR